MNLQHYNSGELKGQMYCGENMWYFEGKIENIHIDCQFRHYKKKEITGHFELLPTDEGLNFDRLKGTWNGPTEIDGKRYKEHGLDFYAAREGYCNDYCHIKKFDGTQKNIEGECMQKRENLI